jgi:hypothetical protein
MIRGMILEPADGMVIGVIKLTNRESISAVKETTLSSKNTEVRDGQTDDAYVAASGKLHLNAGSLFQQRIDHPRHRYVFDFAVQSRASDTTGGMIYVIVLLVGFDSQLLGLGTQQQSKAYEGVGYVSALCSRCDFFW